jgi:D-serine deaminase-like pyridoxal phosphate-dependent protein
MADLLDQLDTPFVAIDLDVMETNLQRMQRDADDHGLALRPHTKTHKQPMLARRQYQLGAKSLAVAKLDEAEVMLNAGLSDLLIAYPLVGASKAHRLATLMVRGLSPTVAVDSPQAVQTLVEAANLAESSIDVLVEVDTGFHRCGVTGMRVAELAQMIANQPRLCLRGLMSFAGHIAGVTDAQRIRSLVSDDDAQLGAYRQTLSSLGLPIDTISVGGTVLSHHLSLLRHATEIRSGIYIFNDMGIVYSGAVGVDDCAARIWATVVSHPADDRVIVDAGSKMLSSDGPLQNGYGYVVGKPGWRIARLSEEHAIIELAPDAPRPVIGQRVAIIPNHVCTVINLQNDVVGVRGSTVEMTLPIAARGGTR